MSAYMLLQIEVNDTDKISEYYNAAPLTVKNYGGELVFRSNISKVLCGQSEYTATVVLKFPDQVSAEGWYFCDEYQALLENRDKCANVVVTEYVPSDYF